MYDTLRRDDIDKSAFEKYLKVKFHSQYKHRYLAKPDTRKLFEPMLTKDIPSSKITDDMLQKELDAISKAVERDIKEYQDEYDTLIKYNKEKCITVR